MEQARERTVYRFFDEYGCNYIFLRLPGDDSFFFVGPYLLTLPKQAHLRKKVELMGLSEEQLRRIQLYYAALPVIEDENWILSMVNTFATLLWGSPERYRMEYVDYAIPDRYEPVPFTPGHVQNPENPLSLGTLEENYAREKQLMDAVSKGQLQMVTAVASTVFNNGAVSGISDSLRDRKNNLVILKTLLRKAAEYGGVHPLNIHRLSSHFAGQIEGLRTMKQSFALQEEMIRSYCLLVKHHSLSSYSYYVGQTITLIQYDLTADLRLKTIAEKLNVNGSYLSTLFHREVGCTLTAYINRQRIDRGIHLLQNGGKSVQEIAAECGVQDVNYFIKLFKKQTGFTPNRYREEACK
jgi:AraC-like DNA-binding protein